jgi:hypothetical protein
VYDAGKETFTKEHLKNNSKNFSRERLQRNYSDKKSDLAYEQRGFISVSASASPPVAGSSPLVPYNSQRVKAQAGMQMDWDAVRNVNDDNLVCKLLRYLTLLEYLPIPCTMPIKICLQEKGPLQIWDLIY